MKLDWNALSAIGTLSAVGIIFLIFIGQGIGARLRKRKEKKNAIKKIWFMLEAIMNNINSHLNQAQNTDTSVKWEKSDFERYLSIARYCQANYHFLSLEVYIVLDLLISILNDVIRGKLGTGSRRDLEFIKEKIEHLKTEYMKSAKIKQGIKVRL